MVVGYSPRWEEALKAPGAGRTHDHQTLRPKCPHHRSGLGAMGRPLLPGQKAEAREVSSWAGEQASHILETNRECRVKLEGTNIIFILIINSSVSH